MTAHQGIIAPSIAGSASTPRLDTAWTWGRVLRLYALALLAFVIGATAGLTGLV